MTDMYDPSESGLAALEAYNHVETVNHPDHYNQGKYEVIAVIDDWGLDFCAGNVVKYIARYEHKANGLDDLKKAQWYLARLIDRYENSINSLKEEQDESEE